MQHDSDQHNLLVNRAWGNLKEGPHTGDSDGPLGKRSVSLYVLRSTSFRPDQLFKVTEIKQLRYFSTQSPFISTHFSADTLTSPQMALYIPHSIFHLARLLYVRPETFGPYYVLFISLIVSVGFVNLSEMQIYPHIHHRKHEREIEVQIHSFLTSALDGGKQSNLLLRRFTPEINSSALTEQWAPKTVSTFWRRAKYPFLAEPWIVQPSVSRNVVANGHILLPKITKCPHIVADVNMEYLADTYPELKIHISELILESCEHIPTAHVTMHCVIRP